jgi:hypothetical protein
MTVALHAEHAVHAVLPKLLELVISRSQLLVLFSDSAHHFTKLKEGGASQRRSLANRPGRKLRVGKLSSADRFYNFASWRRWLERTVEALSSVLQLDVLSIAELLFDVKQHRSEIRQCL